MSEELSSPPHLRQTIKRKQLSKFATNLLARTATQVGDDSLKGSALVFSPHPDDECLGCGGTLLRKKRAGGKVKLIHITDGSGSHPDLISKQELKEIRARESLDAAAALGVDDTIFLEFEDSNLSAHMEEGTKCVSEILEREKPDEVFIPFIREPMRQAADHIAVTTMVRTAMRSFPSKIMVWEFPVWFWLHWPWVSLRQRGCPAIKTRHVAKNTVELMFGLRAISELRYCVNISHFLDQKLTALGQHRSQMTELMPGKGWTTLGHVSNNEFLQCFSADYEFFSRWVTQSEQP